MVPDRANQGKANRREALQRREQGALLRITLAEGAVMLLLGGLALMFPLVASVWLTWVVALVFLVAGLVSGLSTLARAPHLSRPHALNRFVVATSLVLTGVWMVTQLAGDAASTTAQVAALALAVGVLFVLEGMVASVFSFSHRHIQGWGWGLINGLATLAIGALILTWNVSLRPLMLGILVGISFLFSGLDLLGFGVCFHQPGRDGRHGAP